MAKASTGTVNPHVRTGVRIVVAGDQGIVVDGKSSLIHEFDNFLYSMQEVEAHGLGQCYMVYVTFLRRDGEEIMLLFMLPLVQNHGKIDVFEVQDRCEQVGVGLKIIRKGSDYYLVHQGEIQRYLGSRKSREQVTGRSCHSFGSKGEGSLAEERSSMGILDRIIFFIGDFEVAPADAKCSLVI